MEIQTVFRESEAQTDPFTPEYVEDRTHGMPEVLTIKDLIYGKGLPASMAEMELIDQMREKRAFDNALPPTSDEACFALRRRLMEDQEVREWDKREDDIKRLQNERLNLLQSALVEREKETEEKHAQRTEEWKAASQGTEQEEERTMIENYQERVLDGVSEGIQAEVIARSLDNLSKELVRMKQERRIAAMVRIAEDVRRRREAEESGRRQAEAILRQREDFLY